MHPIEPPSFARLYDAQYTQHQEDLPYWTKLADRFGDPILELGFGTGRVLLHLAQLGHQIAGLDNDPQMLAFTRQALKPPASLRISLHHLDMTQFEFGHPFGLIIVPCNTFAYLDDEGARACLKCCHRHLTPGKPLALDLPNPHLLQEQPPDPDHPITEFVEPDSGNPIQLYAQQERLGSGQFDVRWHYDELKPDGTVQRHTFQQQYHLRSSQAITALMIDNGFKSVEIFGDYEHAPLEADSPRMLVVALAG